MKLTKKPKLAAYFIIGLSFLLVNINLYSQSIIHSDGSYCVGVSNIFVCPGVSVTSWTVSGTPYVIEEQDANHIKVRWNALVTNAGVTAHYGTGQSVSNFPITISTPVTPSISISANKNNICGSTAVTFTATVSNGGTSPIFTWHVNGAVVSTASSYTSSTLSNGDVVDCSLYANVPCYTTNPATSNAITMAVTQPQALSVSISGSTSICTGTQANFNAVVSNPPSTGTLTYQWKKNGANVSSNVGTPPPYVLALSSINNNDVISCVVSSTAGCYTSGTSNSIKVTVTEKQTFSASVGPNKIGMCQNESITFTAGSSHPASSYQWMMNGSNVSGATSNTFTTTASSLAQLQSVKVTVTTAAGCLNNTSATGSAATIPFTITPTVGTPSTPSGPLTRNIGSGTDAYTTSATNATSYTWSISPAGAGTISGTGTTGTVTWNASFSGTATIGVKANGCNGPSAQTTRTVTVYLPVVPGTVASSQNINFNGTASPLTVTGTSGGDGTYTYQWQSSTSASFSSPTPVGTNSTSYTPPTNVAGTRYYRVTVKSNNSTPVPSNYVTITVYPQVVPGTVASSQNINLNGTASPLTVTGTSGGDGTYTYQWQSSTSASFSSPTPVGTNSTSYTPPTNVTGTRYYRVTVKSNNSTPVPSNYITIVVYPQVTTTVSPTSKTINYNTSPGLLNNTPGGGNGSYTYVWEKGSSSSGPWSQVAATQDYTPPALTVTTYYKITTTSNGVPATTIVTITVYPQLIVGAITPSADQVLNYNAAATPLTIGGVSGGSGTYTYQWQRSAMSSFDNPVNVGSNSTSFTPPTNSSSVVGTYYYRVVVNSNGVPVNSSNYVKVTVYPQLVAGTLSPSSITVNYNEDMGEITGTAATGGNGTYAYRWQGSMDGSTWKTISGTAADDLNYSPGIAMPGGYQYYRRRVTSNGVNKYTAPVQVIVPFNGGTISSSAATVSSGGSATLTSMSEASGGSCTGGPTYQWQSSTDEQNWNNIAGPGLTNITQSAYYRRLATCGDDQAASNTILIKVTAAIAVIKPNSATAPVAGTQTLIPMPDYDASLDPENMNYIKTRAFMQPGITTVTASNAVTDKKAVHQSTTYYDGLGRDMQTVTRQSTPAGHDMVSTTFYDEFGRVAQQWLPYADNVGTGKFRTDAAAKQTSFYNSYLSNTESYYYGNTVYEASPLNRVVKTTAPGKSWTGHDVGVSQSQRANDIYDEVVIWNIGYTWGNLPVKAGFYSPGTLYVNETSDEQLNKTVEYKDKEGHVVLKKVQIANAQQTGHTGWLCTYYVYDDLGNLRCVMQPRAVEYLEAHGWVFETTSMSTSPTAKEFCFLYFYDERNRMVIKRVPGADEVQMVYDKRDRLVFTQDGAQRTKMPTHEWLVTFYDNLNRPVITGLYASNSTQSSLQIIMNSTTGGSAVTVPDPAPADLQIDSRSDNAPLIYTATNSITFLPGFSSGTDDRFEAKIDPTATEGSSTVIPASANNPVPPIAMSAVTLLTQTFYDDYSWNGVKAYNSSYTSELNAGGNSYAENVTKSNQTKGLVTGTKTKVLGTSTWLVSSVYYDAKGRIIQTLTDNAAGGVDITTSQYDFSGKVLSSFTDHKNPLATATPQIKVLTRMEYDHAGRVKAIYKKVNTDTEEQIVDNSYDELGQLKSKELAPGYDGGTGLETLAYEYNIRGWLSAINKNYVKATNDNSYFGEMLSYDYGFNKSLYNGNIAGTRWRSKGDGEQRAYGFDYDNVNRLLKADFTQNNGGWNTSKGIDFSVGGNPQTGGVMQYDANGNIMMMWQKGVKLGNSTGAASDYIDQLIYHYENSESSNQLQNVIDAKTDKNTPLGDFRYSALYEQSVTTNKAATAVDYSYDANGNLTIDKNKDISSITYNYLNLPQVITVTGKGSIEYVYDAAGNKLKKIIHETNKPDKTTLYLMGVYQDNVLQYLPQEEGRIRYKPAAGTDPASFQYDYFIKDHLGNIRMVLTEEEKTDTYPVLSFEGAAGSGTVTNQDAVWSNAAGDAVDVVGTRTARPANMGNPSDNGNNVKLIKKSSAGGAIGAAMLLKVMSGDQINTSVEYYWPSATVNNGSADGIGTLLSSLALALVNSPDVSSSIKGAVTSVNSAINADPNVLSQITNPENNTSTSDYPKAYLHVLLFDEQFIFDATNSQVLQIGESNQTLPLSKVVPVKKNGYAYIYFSNESNNNVYFDNFRVAHKRGRILEETHYYPFGLTMAGISGKALSFGDPKNKKGYNGNELQNEEFSDLSGLEWYDFNARTYDHQIGRFIQVDALSEDGGQESFTPYQFGLDNPILNNDPDGECPSCVIGGIVGFLVDATVQTVSSVTRSVANGETPSLKTVWRDYSVVQGAGAFGAGFVTQGVSAYEEGSAAVVKTVVANATFSGATQLGTDGKIDPIKTAIDAAPIPEYNGSPLINTKEAQKSVRSAENSIESSSSKVPQRKVDQLNDAKNNLSTQNAVNSTYKNAVSSTRETSIKEVANGVNKSLSTNSKPASVALPTNVHSGSDATRVVRPLPIFRN